MIKIFTSKAQRIGKWGEDKAIEYVKGQGYRIVERNVASKYGEIDIIAAKGSITYFFEVKAGYEGSAILPAENLHRRKLGKIRRSVAQYCMDHHIRDRRLQGILILQKRDGAYTVEVIDLI